ncbi:MAG: PilZ domain-containing protein [Geothrix sp.]|nr:PilZ domain-containing protein [Geothrix sp.]
MNLAKSSGGDGREAPIEDPAQIRKAMAVLQQTEAEFPIKVEGTHTLPYTSRIQRMDAAKGVLYLKLIRPLPHEMAVGASFEMLFAVGDQRFEAPITFLGRDSYLLYTFSLPLRMTLADRRSDKRYPFRPREKAYVLAQDAGLPGHGLAGPLVNLSLGGLAFRVDRVVRLADRMRVTPGLGFFEKGKELPMLKIRDLPKHPLFETRGMVANAWERDGEIVVGVQFGELGDAEFRQIQEVLAIREQMQRNPASTTGDGTVKTARAKAAAAAGAGPASRANPAGAQTPDALTRLGRRGTSLLLAMPRGPGRDAVQAALGAAGYLRLDPVDTLAQALDRLRVDSGAASRLLMLEAPAGMAPPLQDLRSMQRELGELRELPVALIQADGMPEETEDALIRPLPWPGTSDLAWLPLLDELAGL